MVKTVRIRVSLSVANELRDRADAQHITIDALLRAALDALQRKRERERLAAELESADQWNQLRKQATSESLALLNDPEERRAAREINAEMASLRGVDGTTVE